MPYHETARALLGPSPAPIYFFVPCFFPPPFGFGVAFFFPLGDLFGVSALGFFDVSRLLDTGSLLLGQISTANAATATTTARMPLG